MAITKVINVEVNTGDANAELEKLEGSFKEVDKAAEKTNKSVDDVAGNGGAIAILDQLTGGLATRLRDAYEASRLFNVSLKATRGALIATGIGAFVVALGTVIVLWDDIIAAIEDANGKLDKQLETTQKIKETLNLELTLLDKKIDLSTRQGKANEELQKQRIELVKLLQEQQEKETALLEKKVANIKASAIELNTREKILKTVLNTVRVGSGDAFILEQRKESLKEIQALEDLILKSKSDQVDINAKLFDLENPEVEPQERPDLEPVTNFDSLNERLQEEERIKEEARQQEILNEIVKGAELEKIAETTARNISDTDLKWADLTNEAKLDIISSGLQGAANLVDQNSIAGKGIALAQTGISTSQGIMQAFATLPTLAAIPASALIAATGIKSTLDILKTKIPSATGRGFVSGGDSGAQSSSAPSFNLIEGTQESQIAEDLQGINQQPVKAVVVSGDVTTAQSVDRNIETESGI